ncbi:UNVERIFIED_CONTAM: hypothetical protein H355_002772 [Colinus virginianus]|nr:hypothetical protein H355_002772 [Colinus virginianus]
MEAAAQGEARLQDEAVDKSNFKECNQIAFYRRQKLLHPGKSLYRALLDTVTLSDENVKFQIIHEENKVLLQVEIYEIEGNIFRLKINEAAPLRARYEVPDVLIKEPATQKLSMSQKEEGVLVLTGVNEDYKLRVTANPFQVEIQFKDEPLLSMNSNGLLYFEHLQPPPSDRNPTAENEEAAGDSSKDNQEDLGLWQEKFGSFLDIKAHGSSYYLDFTNPEVRKWYADQFAFKTYKGSTNILFIWNDMNEPSVFKGAELTMQKDAVHYNNWEHRELHNLYGFYQQMATAEGLIKRSSGKERPFVLTRSFFAGSQKYADVGGFIGDPEPELLVRWYQAGAYQPFFRGHSNMESKRREPWLFGEKNTQIIREAIRERYVLLPYLYTLFYRAHTEAEPVMRPLWIEFPDKLETFGVEDEYMLGNALLVYPVTDKEAKAVSVLLPGSEEVWYDFRKFNRMEDQGTLKIPVTLENACAVGELYLDDGHSFQYLHKKQFLHRKFTFHKNILSSSCTGESGQYRTTCVVERVIFLGFGQQPSLVTACSKGGKEKEVVFTYDTKTAVLILENLALRVDSDWEICIK